MLHHPYLITGSVPLLIAVTGHKNLIPQEMAHIRQCIKNQLAVRLSVIGGKPANVHILTGLAEGADTLMAELALELSIPMIAVLPMPKELYEQEFSTPEALARFHELLGLANARIELPLHEETTAQQVSLAANQGTFTKKRNLQYVALGRYLATNADVLVALWDGTPLKSDQMGGSAHVVQLFRSRGGIDMGKLKTGALNPGDPGLLMHCKVSRQNQPPQADAGLIQWTPSDDYSKVTFQPSDTIQKFLQRCVFHGVNAQASETISAEDEIQKEHRMAKLFLEKTGIHKSIESSKEYFIPESSRTLLSDREKEILHHFGEADSLAIHFQKRRNRCLWIMLLLSIIAPAFACFFSDCPWPVSNSAYWLFGFFASLMAAYGVLVYKRGRIPYLNWIFREDIETEYEDFRALAEGLRVQIAWRLAGIRECVADHYLSRQKDGLGKVSNMLRYCHFLLLSDSEPKEHCADRENLLRKQWVKDQQNWFRAQVEGDPGKNRKSLRTRIKSRIRFSRRVFDAGLLMIVFLLIDSKWDYIPEGWEWIVRGLMAFLPVVAAVVRFHLEITGLEETAEQYERILWVYDKACRLLSSDDQAVNAYVGQLPAAHDLYFHLGCEALSEHGDWLLYNRRKEAGPAG